MVDAAGRGGDYIVNGNSEWSPKMSGVRRSKSWSPVSLADDATASAWEDDSDEGSPVLFDSCRFPQPSSDLLDVVLGEEPWQAASEASSQRPMRIVGEVGALKRLFSLPLRSSGEAVCIHRIGDCLIALEVPSDLRAADDYAASTCHTAATYSPATMRSQVLVEGDMVRVYPRIDSAEPVDIAPPQGAASQVAACCEWRVRDGLSLLAVTPQVSYPGSSSSCDLMDLRSRPPRLMNQDCWMGGDADKFGTVTGIELASKHLPSPPAYHTRVTENHAAVRLVRIPDSLDTEELVDAWLSCCLNGSPSILCFFVDAQGIFRGCSYVVASDIPHLSRVAKAYHPALNCLTNTSTAESVSEEVDFEAFDPRALREMSHTLLETLIDRVDHDGGQCLVMANSLGIHFLNASLQRPGEEESDSGAESRPSLMLMDAPELLPGFERKTSPQGTPTKTGSEAAFPFVEEAEQPSVSDRLRRAHMSQALLLYHAAVRLASPRLQAASSGGLKDVPVGTRWSAKSCCHPLRVRQMMFRAVRALRAAIATSVKKDSDDSPTSSATTLDTDQAADNDEATQQSPFRRRFLLLLASACEFVADTFLAEDSHNDIALDITRQLSALRHLRKSTTALTQYMEHVDTGTTCEDFTQSVLRLEERVLAKRANVHLCLARLRQRLLWSDDIPGLRAIGSAVRELDVAEQLVLHPPRVAQPPRPHGPHECSLLASIAKWKADLLFELVSLSTPSTIAGTDVDPQLKSYLESQQRDLNESPQPLPLQTERWLQSIVSLSLRSLHHLASVPKEIVGELQAQSRALLARAYGDLGHLYASTGRYTKAMTHAKQGIELFLATSDKLHAAILQLWLCRLQLRLAVPQAAATVGILDESALLRGLSAVNAAEFSACTQVVSALQRVLTSLDNDNAEHRSSQTEIQTLLGRVILRQGLSRIAQSAQFFAVCGLCEEDRCLPSVLELVQAGEPISTDGVREAIEMLLQASAYFRDAGERQLNALTHACLAATYFRGRTETRVQRLALTHCQHALEYLRDSIGNSNNDPSALQLAVRLLEAKAMRRTGPKAIGGDACTIIALCNMALSCLQWCGPRHSKRRQESQSTILNAERQPSPDTCSQDSGDERDCPAMPRTVLAGEKREHVPFLSYLRQELGELLLRLLKGNEQSDECKHDLKGLYGTLLSAWHADAGQSQALMALRDYLQGTECSGS